MSRDFDVRAFLSSIIAEKQLQQHHKSDSEPIIDALASLLGRDTNTSHDTNYDPFDDYFNMVGEFPYEVTADFAYFVLPTPTFPLFIFGSICNIGATIELLFGEFTLHSSSTYAPAERRRIARTIIFNYRILFGHTRSHRKVVAKSSLYHIYDYDFLYVYPYAHHGHGILLLLAAPVSLQQIWHRKEYAGGDDSISVGLPGIYGPYLD